MILSNSTLNYFIYYKSTTIRYNRPTAVIFPVTIFSLAFGEAKTSIVVPIYLFNIVILHEVQKIKENHKNTQSVQRNVMAPETPECVKWASDRHHKSSLIINSSKNKHCVRMRKCRSI